MQIVLKTSYVFPLGSSFPVGAACCCWLFLPPFAPLFSPSFVPRLLLLLCLLWLFPGGSFLGWVGHPLHSYPHSSLEQKWNPFLRERISSVCVCGTFERMLKCLSFAGAYSAYDIMYATKLLPWVGWGG